MILSKKSVSKEGGGQAAYRYLAGLPVNKLRVLFCSPSYLSSSILVSFFFQCCLLFVPNDN